MESKFLEKLQFENDKLVLYAPDSLNYITGEMINKTIEKLPDIYNFFGINNFRKLQINLFDDLEKFRNFVLSMRDDKNSLPEYAKGTYDNGMVNTYVHPRIVKGSELYKQKIFSPSHELVHILYWELILKDNYAKRIVWLDEGLAQYLSGQKDDLQDVDNFKTYYLETINSTKILPNLNIINHNQGFVTEDYNGYNLSYLCVKYLFDTKSIEEIRKIVYSYEESIKIGNTILEEMFDYYKNILELK